MYPWLVMGMENRVFSDCRRIALYSVGLQNSPFCGNAY